MAALPYRVAPGCLLTAFKAEVLRQLAAAGEAGSCAVNVVMPSGTLAILVQFGCAEHAPEIRSDLGGRRYRATARGREILALLGMV